MRILITGATGFVGGSLMRACIKRGDTIAVYSRRSGPPFLDPSIQWYPGSFENVPQLLQLIQNFQPDWILHCAGSGSVPLSMQNPAEDFKNSASLTQNLLEAIRISGSRTRLALMSSAALYGNPQSLPICENAAIQPLSPYGWNRYVAEQLFQSYAQSYGIEGVVCRIFSAYGEHLRKQVVYDTFLKTAWSDTEVCYFHGTGNETRDFIHADDLARAVLALCDGEKRGTFNIASGQQTRIGDVIESIRKLTGSTREIVFSGENRMGDPLYWQADVDALKAIGFEPQIDLDTGLKRVWNWIQTERPTHYSP